jgi:hypothetical protein
MMAYRAARQADTTLQDRLSSEIWQGSEISQTPIHQSLHCRPATSLKVLLFKTGYLETSCMRSTSMPTFLLAMQDSLGDRDVPPPPT